MTHPWGVPLFLQRGSCFCQKRGLLSSRPGVEENKSPDGHWCIRCDYLKFVTEVRSRSVKGSGTEVRVVVSGTRCKSPRERRPKIITLYIKCNITLSKEVKDEECSSKLWFSAALPKFSSGCLIDFTGGLPTFHLNSREGNSHRQVLLEDCYRVSSSLPPPLLG